MSDKTARKFEKLRDAYDLAVEARKAAGKATRAVRTLDGEALSLVALGSKAGVKAVAAEVAALREERRALKKLAGFAAMKAPALAVAEPEPKADEPAAEAPETAKKSTKRGRDRKKSTAAKTS